MAHRFIDGLFPYTCVFCRLPSQRATPLCADCEAELPRNASSCSRCAIPLPAPAAIARMESAWGGTQAEPKKTREPGDDTSNARICGACQQHPPLFSQALVPWRYAAHFAHLIQRWKFHGDESLTEPLARLWLQGTPAATAVDIIVPVPLHWRRRWQRGFNQSELLARALAMRAPALGKVDARLVHRQRRTLPQSQMSASQRHANLRAAFTVRKPCDNLHIAIVDDVMTTGATGSSMANTLLNAGAKRVDLWCIARTPAPRN